MNVSLLILNSLFLEHLIFKNQRYLLLEKVEIGAKNINQSKRRLQIMYRLQERKTLSPVAPSVVLIFIGQRNALMKLVLKAILFQLHT